MAELKKRVRADLTTAMKSRDELRASTLRMVLAAVTTAEVSGKQARELSDDEVTDVIVSETKKRREASAAFEVAGRDELADKERAEARILAEYLPEQLSADGIRRIVSEAIQGAGVAEQGLRAMGRVMGAVQPHVRGRADGAAVAAEVRRQLGA